MDSFAYRLTSFVMAFALFGSPAVLSACVALCPDNSVAAASPTDGTQAEHTGHGGVAEPAAVSPHAQHGTAASPRYTASRSTPSPLAPSDTRLFGASDNCCVAGPVTLVAGRGVKRTDGKAFASAPAVSVALHIVAAKHAVALPRPSVPPPSPTRAPLALRI